MEAQSLRVVIGGRWKLPLGFNGLVRIQAWEAGWDARLGDAQRSRCAQDNRREGDGQLLK